MKNTSRLIALLLALAGLAGACSTETTRADLIEDLTTGENPVTEEQANCIADGAEDAGIPFDLAEDEATAEQLQALTDATFACLLG